MKLGSICDPETKEQSKEWRQSGSSRPKNIKTQKSSSKVLASVSWDKDGILLHFEVLKHPAYSPDLAPSNYYLFPNLKKHLKGRKFSSTEEATIAADGWFAAQPNEFFLDRLKKS
jgi:histone-lysine N-methyltransferase SETMAR